MNKHYRARICSLICLLCWTTNGFSVDVEEVIWGFDGRVVTDTFNPLSVLVSNNSATGVEVPLRLTRSNGTGDRSGAILQEVIFLAPFSSRWVQFYPFVSTASGDWTVSWGLLPSQSYDLTAPSWSGRARITLFSASDLNAKKQGVKGLPDSLFPPFVSATENLDALYLDYVPRWQKNQRQSLVDWLSRGGTLFLIPNAAGETLSFSGQLSVLNDSTDRFTVGAGEVHRVADMQSASSRCEAILGEAKPPQESTNYVTPEEGFFSKLSSITRPQHNWPIINLLSVLYVGLVFPGMYLLAKNGAGVRTTLLTFIGIAAVFTVVFNVIGRRGYGESTVVNSIALARHVAGESYDVMGWTNVFVTGGDQYLLRHDHEGGIYSTGITTEKVGGTIDNGLENIFAVDIPLFSSRPFLHRGKLKGPNAAVQIDEVSVKGTRVESLKIRFDAGIVPSQSFAIVASGRYPLRRDGEFLVYEGGYQELKNFVSSDPNYAYPYYDRRKIDSQRVYDELLNPLTLRAVELPAVWDRPKNELESRQPTNRLLLFCYADMPKEFAVKHEKLPSSEGRVLYRFDLLLDEESVREIEAGLAERERKLKQEAGALDE